MRRFFLCILIIIFLSASFSNVSYAFLGLPQTSNLESLQLVAATQVYDVNGQLISKLFEQNRIVVTMNNMSRYIPQAIIANEDTRFYNHIGVDPIGILRALWVNIRSGGIAEGGSTVTQQLAREMFLTQERTIVRKLKEALLAMIIESKFSKQEILQAYLNQVYFGEGAYGVEAAAQVYFGKHASELSLGQSAMIAGLARGPNLYSPYADMKAAINRRAVVLSGMVKEGYITQAEADEAQAEPLVLAGKKKRTVQASYFIDYIANDLVGKYGANRVYKGGLKVYTTMDTKIQQAAEAALGQYQGAVLVMDSRNGHIKAMVGGRNYQESQINRAIADIRQPGSAFKPFVYATALNKGLTPNAIIYDEPINISGYSPQNYDNKFRGPVTMKKALRWSVNTASVKLAQQTGMTDVLNLAKSMGITTLTADDDNLSAALGGLTQGVNLLELTTAYTAFANNGVLSQPIGIIKVLDENNQVLEENRINQQFVLQPEISYIMTNMMMGVLEAGTGTAANIGRPAAGKTGTTDNYETAWFIGYTPELVAGIYVGNDDRTSVGISGSQVAAFWGKMMSTALSNNPPQTFSVPPNIITGVAICADTGLLAGPACPDTEYSSFIRGTEPTLVDNRLHTNLQPSQPGKQNEKRPRWKLNIPRLPSF
ncbi:transglycosylase domain-containing protein [Dendrosporobacter sp. 1207_IL3150]|uniref:transglycosylase domain-containing protein n=1 Tax=Dendrosporobacter sp. 1207_IL3150 TaxID=3084054 RepID=UPI002FDAE109